MKSVNVGLIGLGTIGRGVYDVISENFQMIARKTGLFLKVKGICDKDKNVLKAVKDEKDLIKTTSPSELISREDIDIIVELIGGVNPAKDIILGALKNKKHVVTANKALLSECWKEIFSSAAKNKMYINFEASVGGAIPIIRALRSSFVTDNINTLYGILNGTTNFILTEMEEKGCSFETALKIAQKKGIAERNPELDISGADSAHKLAILSFLAFGSGVEADDIYTEGITAIEPVDIQNARHWGYSIKLLAIAKDTPAGLQLRVHPTLLESSHLLSNVKGEDNAVFVRGELIGESLLFGKGAGRKPTSNSVVSDIVDIGRQIAFAAKDNLLPYNLERGQEKKKISKIKKLGISFYLRFSVIDKPGVLAEISSILAKNNISIANVSQEERKEGAVVPVVILTHKAEDGSMREAIAKIDKLSCVAKKTVAIRIEE
ncbi:MAG: homoserine dehydrogenase [Candidatus Omnitrophota bacterium]